MSTKIHDFTKYMKQRSPKLGILLQGNRSWLRAIALVTGACLILMALVLVPSWMDPKSRFYESQLGYPAVLRLLGRPIPVEAAMAQEAVSSRWIVGEGACTSRLLMVGIFPVARVDEVLVRPGSQVKPGDVLARLDERNARARLQNARLALSSAHAESARVQAGSSYNLANERPDVEKVNLKAEESRAELARQKLESYKSGFAQGVIAKNQLLEVEAEFAEARRRLENARLRSTSSTLGSTKSLGIASNVVEEARSALTLRESELNDCVVKAPDGGVVERVLLNPGEIWAGGGKPGFIISSGQWFEALLDQGDLAFVKEGQEADIHLEAYPGAVLKGVVRQVVPIVSSQTASGDPLNALRARNPPPSTFRVQIDIKDTVRSVAVGMTGFARLKVARRGLCVPRGALASLSAGTGMVQVVTGRGTWDARLVEVGIVETEKVEILSGLQPGDVVMVRGHWVLRKGDRVKVTRTWSALSDSAAP